MDPWTFWFGLSWLSRSLFGWEVSTAEAVRDSCYVASSNRGLKYGSLSRTVLVGLREGACRLSRR